VKVILTHDIPNLGHAGDVKDVAAGYARNYLFREGLAVKASKGAMKDFERRRAADARREEKMAARAEALAKQLEGITLTFEAKAGETGHLYGSVTPSAIAEALEREVGEKFDRRKHILSDPLREVGEHTVPVRLSADVVAEVKVVVKPEGGELPPAEAPGTAKTVPEGSQAEE
jgi:large subunit ribosomal protein L9